MKVYLAADHTGLALKAALLSYVCDALHGEAEDLGAFALSPEDDYPDLVMPCAERVAAEQGSFGIVIGGSGQGEAIAVNRVPGARCALYYGPARALGAIDAADAPSIDGLDIVRLARAHNDANLLSLGARFVTEEEAREAVRAFLSTPFSGEPRHARRIAKL